ncbi:hypothetical protein CRG98_016477 [Punica granatum]|uniref:Uncharacterized protein n=1 Tax=Punica granatum TaxID=22663 RepID=A0A2I0K3L1_PUNGR|nr:hypothetical protein CRG98_016477 [Punica granatum]
MGHETPLGCQGFCAYSMRDRTTFHKPSLLVPLIPFPKHPNLHQDDRNIKIEKGGYTNDNRTLIGVHPFCVNVAEREPEEKGPLDSASSDGIFRVVGEEEKDEVMGRLGSSEQRKKGGKMVPG